MYNTDRLLNKIISVLLFAVLLIMLTIGSIFILPPSFAISADDVFTLNYASSLDSIGGALTADLVDGYSFWHSDYRTGYYCNACITSDFTAYLFLVKNSASSSTTNKYTAYVAVPELPSSNSTVSLSTYSSTNTIGISSSSGNLVANSFDTYGMYLFKGATDYYDNTAGTNGNYHIYDNYFDTIEDAFVAIGNAGGGTFSAERTITIQPGYVAYIETDGGTLDITAQFPIYSRLWRPLWDSSVQIAFGVFYPSAGFTFTDNFGSAIDWLIPASAPTNLLGQSKIGARSYTAGLPDNGSNVAIYNPAYGGVSSNSNSYGRALKAPTLTVTISNCVWVRWYELRTSATISPASGSAISAGSDDNYISSVNYYPTEDEADSVVTDADTFNFNSSTNTTSAGVTMNAGGSNYGTDDTVEDANNLLNNLEEKITSLLSAPINHITNLVNNATAFFAEIIHFFDWLPPEVRSVIVSCLALIPVIGFIKLLF